MGEDQDFLSRYIWPVVKSNTLEHDSTGGRSFGGKEVRGFPSVFATWHNDFYNGQSTGKYGPVGLGKCVYNCSFNVAYLYDEKSYVDARGTYVPVTN